MDLFRVVQILEEFGAFAACIGFVISLVNMWEAYNDLQKRGREGPGAKARTILAEGALRSQVLFIMAFSCYAWAAGSLSWLLPRFRDVAPLIIPTAVGAFALGTAIWTLEGILTRLDRHSVEQEIDEIEREVMESRTEHSSYHEPKPE
jgi:hypothetical protein